MGRRYRNKSKGMTDRERLLTQISSHISPFTRYYHEHNPPPRNAGVHWWMGALVPGDLIRASTSGVHPFTWSYFVEAQERAFGTCVVRDIASDAICYISNDSFYALRGIPRHRLLYGAEHEFYLKVLKAIHKLGDYYCRFCDIRFDGNEAFIKVRPHSWAAPRDAHDVTAETSMKFTRRTPIKQIQAHLDATLPQSSEAWKAYLDGITEQALASAALFRQGADQHTPE